MPNIIVYGTAMGTSFRVHWTLHEIGLAYETKSVDFRAKEHKSPEFLKLNPMGQIPVINVDGFITPESLAITHYLATKFSPALLGGSPETQAEVLRWSVWNMLHINTAFETLSSVKWTGQALAPEVLASTMEKLSLRLPILETQLEGKEFILGAFSLADINVRATFMYGEMVEFDFTAYPNISAWLKRTAERPSYISAKG